MVGRRRGEGGTIVLARDLVVGLVAVALANVGDDTLGWHGGPFLGLVGGRYLLAGLIWGALEKVR